MRSPQTEKANLLLLGLAFILIGLNLRPILASVGPLLPSIQKDISLSFTLLLAFSSQLVIGDIFCIRHKLLCLCTCMASPLRGRARL